VAVATQAIGTGGAANAGLMATQILALSDRELAGRLGAWRQALTDNVTEAVT
jgi:5-(carboxyamino)imidazole ribonucleotide mutase